MSLCGQELQCVWALCGHKTRWSGTPIQYLNQIRVEAATEMLQSDANKSVTAIALDCGFATSQYFATVFRTHHHCSPSQFRANGIGEAR